MNKSIPKQLRKEIKEILDNCDPYGDGDGDISSACRDILDASPGWETELEYIRNWFELTPSPEQNVSRSIK